jgi:sugar phosphate isomerase/epimerase
MKFSTVLSTHPTQFDAVVFKGNFNDNVAYIAGLGYDGLELAIRDPKQVGLHMIMRTLAQHNLAVPAIGTGQAYGEEKLSFTDVDRDVRQTAVARIKSHINLAAELSAVVILGLIRGRTPPQIGQTQAMEWLVAALRDCAETAYKQGVKLVIEPINRYETDLVNTIAEGMDLLEQVGADEQTLGLLPDTFHMNIEEPSIIASLRQAAPHIFHFHVADSNRWYPGAGHLDFRKILAFMRDEIGYDGWVSAETLPHPNIETAAEQGLRYLQACLTSTKETPYG